MLNSRAALFILVVSPTVSIWYCSDRTAEGDAAGADLDTACSSCDLTIHCW